MTHPASVLLLSLVVALVGIHLTKTLTETVNLDSFAVGDCVEVVYIAPSTKRVTIYLIEDNDDVLLFADYRVEYRSQYNTLALRSQVGGSWSKMEYLEGIKSTPGTSLKFLICAIADNEVSIVFNGKLLKNYSYDDVSVNHVREVTVNTRGSKAQIQEICINYA